MLGAGYAGNPGKDIFMSKGSKNRSNPKKYRESGYWQSRAQEKLDAMKIMGRPVEKHYSNPPQLAPEKAQQQ